MKNNKTNLIIIISLLILSLGLYIVFGGYGVTALLRGKNNSIRYFGSSYTAYENAYERNALIPYGDETALWFLSVPKEKQFFGMAFSSVDKAKNFVYDHSFSQTRIYKKNDFNAPAFSKDMPIDHVMIYNGKTEQSKTIDDKETIHKLVAYYCDMEEAYSPNGYGDINAYAFCNSLGGVYKLAFEAMDYGGQMFNESPSGRHILPQELTDILLG